MANKSIETLRLVERELLKFGSYENANKILSKYMIGSSYDKEMVEKILVILVAEFRQQLERMGKALPEDEAEAEAAIERKISRKKTSRKSEFSIELADDIDLSEFDDD